jgi:hypothetical protein
MNPLIIEKSKNTPRIFFDPTKQYYEIIGESRPENVRLFYEPVCHWIENQYNEIESHFNAGEHLFQKIDFHVKLGYFNSSSAKFIFDILHKLYQLKKYNIQIQTLWFYDEGDEDMKQAGIDLAEMLEEEFSFRENKD